MSAQSFLIRAITNNCKSKVITIDISGSNTGLSRFIISVRSQKLRYDNVNLNNIVEQDHRFIKWRLQNSLGFKSFESAKRTLSEIEVIYMLRENQMINPGITIFKSFCKLAA
jgi:putative transposase